MTRVPVFVIAEAGVNHNGDVGRARELIHIARASGADAVKFQTFEPEKLVTRKAQKATYQRKNTDNTSKSQFEMLSSLTLSQDEHRLLKEEASKLGIQFLSTPFDEESLKFLLDLGIDRIKIGSGDITHGMLLLQAARSGKEIILSTGMSNYGDITNALSIIEFGRDNPSGYPKDGERRGASRPKDVSLLHCVSQYPAPLNAMNLRVIPRMIEDFSLPIGLSDHTVGISAAIAAVSLGATIIEKHFTLDKNLPGPDHKASLDPKELQDLVSGIREVEEALGHAMKECVPEEVDVRQIARRSLVASVDIKAGEKFSAENLTAKRPATGQSPLNPWRLYGKVASRNYNSDDAIDE